MSLLAVLSRAVHTLNEQTSHDALPPIGRTSGSARQGRYALSDSLQIGYILASLLQILQLCCFRDLVPKRRRTQRTHQWHNKVKLPPGHVGLIVPLDPQRTIWLH